MLLGLSVTGLSACSSGPPETATLSDPLTLAQKALFVPLDEARPALSTPLRLSGPATRQMAEERWLGDYALYEAPAVTLPTLESLSLPFGFSSIVLDAAPSGAEAELPVSFTLSGELRVFIWDGAGAQGDAAEVRASYAAAQAKGGALELDRAEVRSSVFKRTGCEGQRCTYEAQNDGLMDALELSGSTLTTFSELLSGEGVNSFMVSAVLRLSALSELAPDTLVEATFGSYEARE